jgi:tetratricopeptide (TPR) repeat protein
MKAVFRTAVCVIIVLGQSHCAHTIFALAADVAPATPAAAKQATEETKKDTPPVKDAAQQEQIAKLISQLGDDDYYVRQHAQNELERLGFEAFDALSAATNSDDLEIASRAKFILRSMRVEWTAKNDPQEIKNLLKDYELLPEEARQARMHSLALMPEGKGIVALCRLVRFEKSDVLSKQAAVEILQSPSGGEPLRGPRAEQIRKLFQKSARPSAAWVLAWLRLADEPQSAARFDPLIQNEISVYQHSPHESGHDIIFALIRYQVAWMKKHGQMPEAQAALRRIIDLENGAPETLSDSLDWLVQEKAWKIVDELYTRFAARFDAEPALLYVLAQAQKEQGDADKAEKTAQRAFQINPGREEIRLYNRAQIAQRLSKRGLFPWARREFEYIIAQGDSNNMTSIDAQWTFSEMLHDQGEDLTAANVLEVMLKKADSKTNPAAAARVGDTLQRLYLFRRKTNNPGRIADLTISELRARVYYLQACHWDQAGDPAKKRECLEKAAQLEPCDIDVLIACYRLPDQTPEYQKKIKELIRQTADDIRVEISAQPDNPSLYNQFAWLVGNTEGNFDEALKYSQKSLELAPGNGGLYDTMARVYYAKGDYENALKNQEKAAELEPHSGQIAKQLELFRKAREEHRK